MNKQDRERGTYITVCNKLLNECNTTPQERKFIHGTRRTLHAGGNPCFQTKSHLGKLSVKYFQYGQYQDANWWKSKEFES